MEDIKFLHNQVEKIKTESSNISTYGYEHVVSKVISNVYFIVLTITFLLMYMFFPRKTSDVDDTKRIEWGQFLLWYIIVSLILVFGISRIQKYSFI